MSPYERDLRVRAREFAVAVYGLSKDIRDRHPALRNAGEQVFRAAGSVGANLAESEGLNSRKELAARFSIALKESREALYWLELIAKAEPSLSAPTRPLVAECKEFVAMLTTGLQKLRS